MLSSAPLVEAEDLISHPVVLASTEYVWRNGLLPPPKAGVSVLTWKEAFIRLDRFSIPRQVTRSHRAILARILTLPSSPHTASCKVRRISFRRFTPPSPSTSSCSRPIPISTPSTLWRRTSSPFRSMRRGDRPRPGASSPRSCGGSGSRGPWAGPAKSAASGYVASSAVQLDLG